MNFFCIKKFGSDEEMKWIRNDKVGMLNWLWWIERLSWTEIKLFLKFIQLENIQILMINELWILNLLIYEFFEK